MTALVVILAASFFLLLGVAALRKPSQLLWRFGVVAATADARNEIRAVYGGFPLAMAAALASSLLHPELAAGVIACASAALFGMAAGRVLSAAIDGCFGRLPMIFTAVEVSVAGLLTAALLMERAV